MKLTEKQRKIAEKLFALRNKGDIALVEHIVELQEKIENAIPTLENLSEKMKGDKGYTPVKGVDYFDGKDGEPGKNYILTNQNLKTIASMVKVPIVDRVIEKQVIEKKEVTREIPIVTEVHKELLPEQIIEKINLSESKISIDRIEGIENLTNGNNYSEEIKTLQNRTQLLLQISTQGQRSSTTSTTPVTGGVGSWSTPPESPAADGSVKVYTVGSTAPTDILADGAIYPSGTVWTHSSNQITISLGGVGPTSFIRYR